MCDDLTELDNKKYAQRGGLLNRREFGKLTAMASMLALVPPVANALDVTESAVTITTPDGEAEAYFVHPASGKHPAVLMWTDILGLRNAFRTMATRLAQSGYSVLVPNPFYRSAKIPVVPEGASFRDEDTRNLLRGYAGQLNQEAVFSDAKTFIGFLDQQDSVDTSKKVSGGSVSFLETERTLLSELRTAIEESTIDSDIDKNNRIKNALMGMALAYAHADFNEELLSFLKNYQKNFAKMF